MIPTTIAFKYKAVVIIIEMTDIHNDYLKDEHLDEEDELNLHSQKSMPTLKIVYHRDA